MGYTNMRKVNLRTFVRQKLVDLLKNENGDAAQFLLAAASVIIPLIIMLIIFGDDILLYLIKSRSISSQQNNFNLDSTFYIFIFSTIIAILAWLLRLAGMEMANNAKLHILETLSSNGAMSRDEIVKSTKGRYKTFIFLPIIIQASISSLLHNNKITLDNGLYRLVNY